MIRLLILPRPQKAPDFAAKLRLVLAVHNIAEDDEGESGPVVASKFEMEQMEAVR